MGIRYLTLALAAFFVLSGCDGDGEVVSHSGDIGMNVNLKANDIVNDGTNDILADGKNITTESGNPCGVFTTDARKTLGRDPSAIRVNDVSLELAPNPVDATTLADLWDGTVTVFFVLDDNGTPVEVPIAEGTPSTAGPESLMIIVTETDLQPYVSQLTSCNYEVRVSGVVDPMLPASFDVGLIVTVNLSALR